jgi:type IV pilus assembly protein PilW
MQANKAKVFLGIKFRGAYQAGVTLVELLIAMVLTIVVVVAASSVYLISSQSFTTVDASTQLQDSARFATYILRRMAQQSGYEDYSAFAAGLNRAQASWPAGTPVCAQSDICGFDNQVAGVAAITSGTGVATGTLPGGFYTDTLVVQFQGQSLINTSGELTATADQSMIDCSGDGVPSSTVSPPVRGISSLYVSINSITSEPELNCSSRNLATGEIRTVPLVKGVEVFQVMYEVANKSDPDKGPDQFRWLRADQVATAPVVNRTGGRVSDAVNAWQHVVAVRFGLVLRGDRGAGPPSTATAPQTYYPLGRELADPANPATTYVAPNDSRLRRVVTFTAHIRNVQDAYSSVIPTTTP